MTKEDRKEAILDKQLHMALEGSIEMLKWLGIQYCNQDNRPSTPQDELPNGFNLVGGYHPSPRNVNTGRLSKAMMIDLLNDVKNFI